MELELIEGTTTIFTFTDGTGCNLGDGSDGAYTPSPAAVSEEWTWETIPLTFIGGPTTLDAKVSTINSALHRAMVYERERSVTPIYLKARKRSTDAWMRALIRDGRLTYDLDEGQFLNTCEATLEVERVNHWEAFTEGQIQLTNTNGSNNTSGLPIYPCNDGSGVLPNDRCSYVSMAAADVLGDLPAPCRVEITNVTSGQSGTGLSSVVMGLNYHDPANMPYQLEAESQAGAVAIADAACSAGLRVAYTIDNGSISGPKGEIPHTLVQSFALSAAQTAAAKGMWFHGVVRFQSGNITDLYWWLEADGVPLGKIKPSAGSLYSIGAGTYVLDLGAFQIPARLANQVSTKASSVTLYAIQTTGDAEAVSIDYLALMPADSWCKITSPAAGVVINHNMIDDVYYSAAADGTGKNGYLWVGEKIMLQPGKLQRIYFWFQGSAEEDITDRATVKIYYRARRRNL